MDFKTAAKTNGFAKYAAAIQIKSAVRGVESLAKPQQFKSAVKTSTRPVDAVVSTPAGTPRPSRSTTQAPPPPSRLIPVAKNAFRDPII